jgi:hypothetical protein
MGIKPLIDRGMPKPLAGNKPFRPTDYAQAAFDGQANYRHTEANVRLGFLIDSFYLCF